MHCTAVTCLADEITARMGTASSVSNEMPEHSSNLFGISLFEWIFAVILHPNCSFVPAAKLYCTFFDILFKNHGDLR